MTASSNPLKVTSNVARDILQSASVFKTLHGVAWEYVSNSLQYIDQGTVPRVSVKINSTKRTMSISDNGSGMDEAALRNFFTMHGINHERLSGKGGRGMFGTGKSAAFGIAERLVVRTVRDGKRNIVELSRSDIEQEANGGTNVNHVPLKRVEADVLTQEDNGTVITIEGIGVKCEAASVIAYIERHIGRGFKGAELVVNGQEVEYNEPSFSAEFTFPADEELRASLGDVNLVVRVSQSPLDEDRRGIDITSRGVLFETTLGSVAGKEMSQYIFGELEVASLIEEGTGANPAFNMTRDMKLNLENNLVRSIHAFVSTHVDSVRRGLVDADRLRRQTEEAQRLQKQADDIARLLNADFADLSDKVERVRATVSSVSRDRGPDRSTKPGESLMQTVFGGDELVEIIADQGDSGGLGKGRSTLSRSQERFENPMVAANEDGDPFGRKTVAKPAKSPSRGGFQVQYQNLGSDDVRAKYDRENRSILINLDFPQIVEAIKSDGLTSLPFKRLSNEVAITEYAIAVTSELVRSAVYQEPSDILYEIRQTINRINRRSAESSLAFNGA